MPLKIRLGLMFVVILFSVFAPVDILAKDSMAEEAIQAQPPTIIIQIIIVPYCSLPPLCPAALVSNPASKPVDLLRQKVIDLAKRNLTEKEIDEILIIASLIEREGKDSTDKPIVSAVISNRLAKNMKLQLDVSAYTYKYSGLPPTMMVVPNAESIKAALNPAKTDALFFIHDKSGRIHSSLTFTDHLKNVEKYLKT